MENLNPFDIDDARLKAMATVASSYKQKVSLCQKMKESLTSPFPFAFAVPVLVLMVFVANYGEIAQVQHVSQQVEDELSVENMMFEMQMFEMESWL